MRLSVPTAAAFGNLNVTSAVPSSALAAAGATSAATIRHAHAPFQPLIDLPFDRRPARAVQRPAASRAPAPDMCVYATGRQAMRQAADQSIAAMRRVFRTRLTGP